MEESFIKVEMSELEKEKVLNEFNNTKKDYPRDKTIHGIFEEQVIKTPKSIAAIFGSKCITYEELNEKSNQLARLLRRKGIKPNDIVGIMLERSLEMIIGIYGILKSSGAYLPISPENPDKRLEYIIEDSGIDIILTQGKYIDWLSNKTEVINLEDQGIYCGSFQNLENISKPEDLIYVIYTSGSTGNPKGVLVEHKSVVNRLNWMQNKYPIDNNDTILQKTPFVFDVSVWEMFWWSFVGARVCFMNPGYEKFPIAIVDAVEKNNVTVMHSVPSMLNAFLNYINSPEVSIKLSTLKIVFASGEALTAVHVNKFNNKLYKQNATRLINLYGPTEATVDVSYFNCPTDEECSIVPIGKPIDNTNFYVIDDNKLQPVGKEGELYISGDCVARGYLNRPDLTKEKFLDNPFMKGYKMYRTGDLVRWLSDGNLEFLGRLDHQVKIRGLRIELGEIESIINGYESIDECSVSVKNLSELLPTITAYIVPKEGFLLDGLKYHIKKFLPEYMIPNRFIIMEKLPLTSNGKVDKNALNRI